MYNLCKSEDSGLGWKILMLILFHTLCIFLISSFILQHIQKKILKTVAVYRSISISVFRIHEVQQEIKKQTEVAENLRKQILMGGPQLSGTEVREPSRTLRKLLNQSEPQRPQQHEILAVKKDIELVKFRVQLLSQEKSRKLAELRRLSQRKNTLYESNQDKGTVSLPNILVTLLFIVVN